MPVRSLNLAGISPPTVAMFDLLADGAWHRNPEIVSVGAAAALAHEHDEALTAGRRVRRKTLAKGQQVPDADLADSGSKDIARNRLMIAVRSGRVERDGDQHRMLEDTIAQWKALRPAATTPLGLPVDEPVPQPTAEPVATVTAVEETATTAGDIEILIAETAPNARGRKPLIFGRIPEKDGWAYAPLTPFERVHFRIKVGELPLDAFRADLPEGVTVTLDDGEGLYRVDCEHGTGTAVADLVRAWCEVYGYVTVGLRVDPVKRRSPRDLPQAFLDDLCAHYGPFSLKRLQRNMSSIRMHIPDPDDVIQQVYEWILGAVERYDDTKGVPFGAYLATQLTKWVHDLNRNAYGRTAADAENKQQKAIAAFVADNQRRPSEEELADYTGQNVETLRRNEQTIATLNGLRNVQSIDTGSDAVEIPLPDAHEAPDQIMDDTDGSILSHALTAACAPDDSAKGRQSQPNVLGWAALYFTTYGGQTKTDLAQRAGTSMRNMNVYAGRVQDKMRATLAAMMN